MSVEAKPDDEIDIAGGLWEILAVDDGSRAVETE
jgi:hypothetical protein